jgi:hypothetical protein
MIAALYRIYSAYVRFSSGSVRFSSHRYAPFRTAAQASPSYAMLHSASLVVLFGFLAIAAPDHLHRSIVAPASLRLTMSQFRR